MRRFSSYLHVAFYSLFKDNRLQKLDGSAPQYSVTAELSGLVGTHFMDFDNLTNMLVFIFFGFDLHCL